MARKKGVRKYPTIAMIHVLLVTVKHDS